MIKKLLLLLTTISINTMDLRNFHENLNDIIKEQYHYVGSYNPSLDNPEILKAKYDLDFKNGFAKNEKYLAFVNVNYQIVVYKKKPKLKRNDAFAVYDELTQGY